MDRGLASRIGDGLGWPLAAAAGVLGGLALKRCGWPGSRVAALLLAAASVPEVSVAAHVASQVVGPAARRGDQDGLVAAHVSQALADAHDLVPVTLHDLAALLEEASLGSEALETVAGARAAMQTISVQLNAGREEREHLRGEDGRVPVLGARMSGLYRSGERLGGNPVTRWYGLRDSTPRLLPGAAREVVRQVGLVLDEVRLNHSAEIERPVFLFTLSSRAVLVTLSPQLGAWTFAPAAQPSRWRAQGLVWTAASAVSIATAARAGEVVTVAMTDSAEAQRFRGRLLAVEGPLAVATALFCPSWTMMLFSSGVANWWQRQSPGLAFDWRKLLVYVAAVGGLQAAGLRRQSVPPARAAAEIAATLSAIAFTGGSYGAMLPVTVGTAVNVVVGDGRRSLGAILQARSQLLSQARRLRAVAQEIDATLPDNPVAQRAANTARQAAHQLELSANRAGRRGLLPALELKDVLQEARARAVVPRLDSSEWERNNAAAEARGEPPPPYTIAPSPPEPGLRHAKFESRRHAQALRSLAEHAINEAGAHGTGAVRTLIVRDGDRVTVRISNQPRPGGSHAGGGHGGHELQRLADQLPGGQLIRGSGPRSLTGAVTGAEEWWVVEVSFRIEAFVPTSLG